MASCSVQIRVPQKEKSSQTRTARRCVEPSCPSYTLTSCLQIHYISESIRCCGAGTAADTEFVTASISSNIELHALSTGRQPRVVTAMTMLKQYLFQYVMVTISPYDSHPWQIPGPSRRCTCSRRCRFDWSSPLHGPPPWLD